VSDDGAGTQGSVARREHRHRIRVRYAESDQMGFAHHANYVVWLEEARIEWLRAVGLSYRELEAQGVLMPVIEVGITYKRSFRFDDDVELVTRAEVLGRTRVSFATRIQLHGEDSARAEGRVVIAAVNREGRPQRIPDDLVRLLA
jgi:acyl-CoA thioester hydrolase